MWVPLVGLLKDSINKHFFFLGTYGVQFHAMGQRIKMIAATKFIVIILKFNSSFNSLWCVS